MLSSNELSNLYKIISDENQTFESISRSFLELFKESDHMRIVMSIYILIKDNLFNLTQRIISLYIIYLMKNKFNFEVSPFIPLVIENIQRTNHNTEQNFLIDFLNNQINYTNTTVKHFLNDNTKKNSHQNIQYLQMIYKKYQFDKGIYGASPKIYDYMRYVIYDRKKREVKNIDNHKNLNIENHINIKEEITMNYSAPNYISYYPRSENKKFVDKEPIWIMPQLKHNFIWEKEDEKEKKESEEKDGEEKK
jgi:hypothetical protein